MVYKDVSGDRRSVDSITNPIPKPMTKQVTVRLTTSCSACKSFVGPSILRKGLAYKAQRIRTEVTYSPVMMELPNATARHKKAVVRVTSLPDMSDHAIRSGTGHSPLPSLAPFPWVLALPFFEVDDVIPLLRSPRG